MLSTIENINGTEILRSKLWIGYVIEGILDNHKLLASGYRLIFPSTYTSSTLEIDTQKLKDNLVRDITNNLKDKLINYMILEKSLSSPSFKVLFEYEVEYTDDLGSKLFKKYLESAFNHFKTIKNYEGTVVQ